MFQNLQVNMDDFPDHRTINWESLDKKYLVSTIILNSIFFSIFMGLYFANHLLDIQKVPDDFLYVIPIAILFLYLLSTLFVVLEYSKKGYAVREKDIYFKEGLLWKSITSIPFNRVQHCEVKQGPIDRYFGLAKLFIYTAGGSSSDLAIVGIPLKRAQNLESFILKKTIQSDEEE